MTTAAVVLFSRRISQPASGMNNPTRTRRGQLNTTRMGSQNTQFSRWSPWATFNKGCNGGLLTDLLRPLGLLARRVLGMRNLWSNSEAGPVSGVTPDVEQTKG